MAAFSDSVNEQCGEEHLSTAAISVKILNTRAELNRKKKTYNSVNLSVLPDKGSKLKSQIQDLEAALENLSLKAGIEISDHDDSSLKTKVLGKCGNGFNTGEEGNAKSRCVVVNSAEQDLVDNCKPVCVAELNNEKQCLPFVKDEHKHLPSFSDLSKTAPSDKYTVITNDLLNSPSFSKWQDPKKNYGVKLTEAKPLLPVKNFKGGLKYGFSSKVYLDSLNEDAFKQLRESLDTYPEDEQECEPETLKTTLMAHQKRALAWLIWREAQTPSGGILADDMGLGKTLTMISLVLKQKELNLYSAKKNDSNMCRGTLVICLASILHQWEDEIVKHCGAVKVRILVYHGPKRDRSLNDIEKYDFILTTYEILMAEKRASGTDTPLFQIKWERIILDEAHSIKSYNTKRADAVFSLKGFRKWCATGTPIHNEIKDMFSLLKFLEFSPFDDYKKFKRLLIDDNELSDQRRDLLVKSILLRRTKDDVDSQGNPLIKMTERTEFIIDINLSTDETDLYKKFERKAQEKVDKYFGKNNKKSLNYSNILVCLLRLQQCCNHAYLLGKETEEELPDSSADISASLSSLSIHGSTESSDSTNSSFNFSITDCENNKLNDISVKSTKMQKLFEELRRISDMSENRDKSVIVSQWVTMLNIIEFHLKQEKMAYYMISGSTKPIDRQKIVDDFNNIDTGPKIMLLSLKAGGIGLNLTGANHLFLTDLHWNPALEMQACDRIWRINQRKKAFIYKFVCKNTIEERIKKLQDHKRSLAKNVLSGAKKCTSGMTNEDFKLIFNISC